MDDIQVDHPYIATEETKHWLRLDSLKDASPCDIVLMNNMNVLLHVLQKTLRAQESIILKIDKKSVHNNAKPTASKIQPKWLKLTHPRSATPTQFVIMSNLWQLFQILQSLHQSQEKVLQTLDINQKGRAKKGRTDVSNNTDSEPSVDSNDSDGPSNQDANWSSEPLSNIITNALDYAYEVYNKFLAKTGCHPYLTNRPSCQRASEAFCGYFIEHEGLVEDSEIGHLVEKLDNDDARKLFITLSKKYHESNTKGKHRTDEDLPTELVLDSQVVLNKESYTDVNKKACIEHALHKNALSAPQEPQIPPSSLKARIQHPNNGIPFPVSWKKDTQSRVQVDPSEVYNKGRQIHSGNIAQHEPLREKRNLPEIAKSQRGL